MSITTPSGAGARLRSQLAGMGLAVLLALSSSGGAFAQAGETADDVVLEPQRTRISEQIAQELGNDPERIFRFVADHVRYEPYSGALRGAAGTFYSRAGNSVDQSLLLERLLNAAGISTRVAEGPIDDATADALLESGVVGEQAVTDQLALALFGRLPDDETVPSLPTRADYVPLYEAEQAGEVDAWAAAEIEDTLELIGTALAESGTEVGGSFSDIPADEREHHTWIQATVDGETIDLDPSLPGAAMGEALAAPATVEDRLPEERWHRLDIAIVAERLLGGELVTEELMRVSGPVADFDGMPIVLTNVGEDSIPTLRGAFEAVVGVRSVRPVIGVGNDGVVGRSMSFKEAGGGLGDGFFQPSDAEEATAQWVELTITSPAEEPITVRRQVFDRVGPVARAAGTVDLGSLAPVAEWDLDGDGTVALAPEHWITFLSVSTGVPSMRSAIVRLVLDDPMQPAIAPFSLQVLDQLGMALDAPPLGVRPFVDAPNVAAVTARVEPGPGGVPTFAGWVDLWHRSSGTARVAGVEAPVEPAMVPGVISHVSERLMRGAAAGASEELELSVGAVFEAAADQGIATTVLSSTSDAAAVAPDAASAELLATTLDEGKLVVAPEQPVEIGGQMRSGWWIIDLADGSVADQLDDGTASISTEKIVVGLVVLALLTGAVGSSVVAWVKEKFDGELWEFANEKITDDVNF